MSLRHVAVGTMGACARHAPHALVASLQRAPGMIWFFKRNDDEVRLETRYDGASAEYLLIQQPRDGRPDIERFKDIVAFRVRLLELDTQFASALWRRRGPVFLRRR